MALVEVPLDPDMCVHLCPDFGPGAFDGGDAGLAALAGALCDADVAEVVDDACDACVPVVELVEALAVVSPNASVAPRIAAPAAVPARGLEILTRYSFLCCGSDPGPPARIPVIRSVPVGQPHLTGLCADLLSPR
jgi:hypothetical protein